MTNGSGNHLGTPTTQQPLFRPEAVVKRKNQYLGNVLIHQPVGSRWAAFTAGLLLCLILWLAYFGTYTRKATVAGLLMPEQGLFRVIAPSAGQVGVVNAREGQSVLANQALFTLATTQLTSAGPTHALIREQLQQRLVLAQTSAKFSDGRQQRERVLTTQRLEALAVELAHIEREIGLLTRREELAAAHRERIRQQADAGFVSPAQLEQAEGDLLALKQQKHAQERARSALLRDRASVQIAQEDSSARHQAQLTDTDTTVAVLRQELAEVDARRELISTAPFSGTVTGVHVQEGSIVAAGALLASLIPDTANLVAHLYASEQKSGFLEVGHAVRLRYAPYPYQKYGMARGTVVGIAQSPYALTELPEHIAIVIQSHAAGQALYYRVTVELDRQSIKAQGQENQLKAGMVVEADIMQDTRRLYEWMLEPIYSMSGKL